MAGTTVPATEAATLAAKVLLEMLVSRRSCENVKVPVQTTLWPGATPPGVKASGTASSNWPTRPVLQVSTDTLVSTPEVTLKLVTCRLMLPVFTSWT